MNLASMYLELLREAHAHAVSQGAVLTGGQALGLGGRIDDNDAYTVPTESQKVNAKADSYLADYGLTHADVVDLLVNQFGIRPSDLAYAWDIPTYPVMREGQLQPEGAPEFFGGNPLDPDRAYFGGEYRPNNLIFNRQGRDQSQSMTTQSAPMSGEGYNPNNPLKRFGQEKVRAHPDAQGPVYERIFDIVPNTPTEWAVELAAGALLGPTIGGRALKYLGKSLKGIPPALLARFKGVSRKSDDWVSPRPDKPFDYDADIENTIDQMLAGIDDEYAGLVRGDEDEVLQLRKAIEDAEAADPHTFEDLDMVWSEQDQAFVDKLIEWASDDLGVEGGIKQLEEWLATMTPEDLEWYRLFILKRKLGMGPDDAITPSAWDEMERLRRTWDDATPQELDEAFGTPEPGGYDIDGNPLWEAEARAESGPPEIGPESGSSGAGGGPPDTPPPAGGFADDARWTDSQLGDFYEALGYRGRDEQGFRIPWAEPDRAAIDDAITEMIHNAGYGDYVDDPLFREFVEGVVSPQSNQRLHGFPSAKNRADLDRLAPEGWPSQSDIEQHPEIARWLEIERELAAKYPDNPDFVQQAHDTMAELHGVRTQDLWEQYPDAETATAEQWRERLGAPPGSTAGDVTPGLGDRVDEAFTEGGFADDPDSLYPRTDRPPFGSAGNPFPEHWSQTRREMWGQAPDWDAPPPTRRGGAESLGADTELVQTPYGQWVTPAEFNRRAKAYKEIDLDRRVAMDSSTGETMSETEYYRRRSLDRGLSPEAWDFYEEHPYGDYETGRLGHPNSPLGRQEIADQQAERVRRMAEQLEADQARWEQMLGMPRTESVPPPGKSMEEAIRSLQGAAGVGMATAITAQTLFPEQVEKVVSGLGRFNDGWWSWIKDFPEHLDWMARATGATLDGMEAGSRSTGDPVLDSLNDGWREQVGALSSQLGGGVMPLMGGTDASMLKGVSRDLSENGHNGNAVMPNDIRREIENGDAMIVGYRTDADYERAVEHAGRYGVEIDRHFWRKPNRKNIRPAEGQPWTSENLKKLATTHHFYPDAGLRRGPR